MDPVEYVGRGLGDLSQLQVRAPTSLLTRAHYVTLLWFESNSCSERLCGDHVSRGFLFRKLLTVFENEHGGLERPLLNSGPLGNVNKLQLRVTSYSPESKFYIKGLGS
jgi:hypothetical protein